MLIAAVVVLALLVGGLTQVSRQSQGYDANSNRSLAAQGAVVAGQSNATASQVRKLVGNLQGQTRQSIEAGLDSAVQQTADQAARMRPRRRLVPVRIAGWRARDRLHRAGPIRGRATGRDRRVPRHAAHPDRRCPGHRRRPPPRPARARPSTLTAGQATNRIAAAGALLARSDDLYRSVQRSLAATAGHARLPKSVWVTDAQLWQAGTVATQVDLMATSPTLAASHYLLLRTVRLNPPALPTPQGAPATVSALSPTSQIGVTVVLGNDGTADEPHAAVRFTLANQATGATATQVESAALALGCLGDAADRDLRASSPGPPTCSRSP